MFWLIFALFAALFVLYYKRTFSYWSSRGVPGPRPWPLIGTMPYLFTDEMRKVDYKMSRKYGKVYGEYLGNKPTLMIADGRLAKQIMVNDFHVFNQSQTKDMLPKVFHKMLIVMHGPDWKRVRPAVSPIFSSGKLRRTLEHLQKPIANFTANLDRLIRAEKIGQVEIRDLCKGYALDVIAKFVFAVEVNSFQQTQDPFVRNVLRLVNISAFVVSLAISLPAWIGRHAADYALDAGAYQYLHGLVLEIVKQRRAGPPVKYEDFVELLLESGSELTDDEISAQCMLFFFAGLDTTSNAMTILLSDLAIHQDVQQKVLEEIREKLGDAPITYETVRDLDYLDAVFMESLRRTPAENRLMRVAQADYQLPGTDLVLEKGREAIVSVYSVHHDESIYPAPFEYRPERFLGEAKKELANQAWFAFGAGPKNCAAVRFATMEVKFFLIQVIRRYEVSMAPDSPVPVQYGKGSFLLAAQNLRLEFKQRSDA